MNRKRTASILAIFAVGFTTGFFVNHNIEDKSCSLTCTMPTETEPLEQFIIPKDLKWYLPEAEGHTPQYVTENLGSNVAKLAHMIEHILEEQKKQTNYLSQIAKGS